MKTPEKTEINTKLFITIITVFILFTINIISSKLIYPSNPDKWYKDLKKSSLNPPSYVFGIAWTILYILIVAAYIIGLRELDYSMWIIPIIHLLLNFSYSPIFFYYKLIYPAAILTTLILIFALLTMYIFSAKSLIAVYLLIPYILWLLFANYLAWSVVVLNK